MGSLIPNNLIPLSVKIIFLICNLNLPVYHAVKPEEIFRQMTSALFLALEPVIDNVLCHCLYNTQRLVQDVSALSYSLLGVDYVPSLV